MPINIATITAITEYILPVDLRKSMAGDSACKVPEYMRKILMRIKKGKCFFIYLFF
jgi:hypothetical protein